MADGDDPNTDPAPSGGEGGNNGGQDPGTDPAAGGNNGGQDPGTDPAAGGDKGGDGPKYGGGQKPPAGQDPGKDPAPGGDKGGDGGEPASGQSQSLSEHAPPNWRELIAGEDKSRMNHLKRIGSLDVLADNYFEAQKKIRESEQYAPLPDDPTEEQVQEYRKTHGIPEKPEDYKLELDEGLELGEEDEAALEPILKEAHEANVPARAMSRIVNAFLQNRASEYDQMERKDGTDRLQTEQELKQIWGPDFDANKNMVLSVLNFLPDNVKESFTSARMPDGTAVFNSPEVMVFFADIARKAMPAATIAPNSNAPMKDLNARKEELEQKMREPGWHKDTQSQQEYQEILRALENLQEQQS